MEINGLSSAAMGGGRSANGVQQGMGQDEFLRLLMTQLQQQDPLNPMDNTEFVSQLSDFASLEQLQNMSTGMEHLAFSQAANTSAQMVSFIGKDVDVSSAEVMLGETGSAPIGLNLSTDAEELEVLVKDEEGRVVRTIEAGKTEGGEVEVVWDGLDEDGNRVDAGNYSFEVTAKDADGESVDATPRMRRRVSGVSFDNGIPMLVLDGETTISLGEVLEVHDASS